MREGRAKGREESVGEPWSSLKPVAIIVSIDARRVGGGRQVRALRHPSTRTPLTDRVGAMINVRMLLSVEGNGKIEYDSNENNTAVSKHRCGGAE